MNAKNDSKNHWLDNKIIHKDWKPLSKDNLNINKNIYMYYEELVGSFLANNSKL